MIKPCTSEEKKQRRACTSRCFLRNEYRAQPDRGVSLGTRPCGMAFIVHEREMVHVSDTPLWHGFNRARTQKKCRYSGRFISLL